MDLKKLKKFEENVGFKFNDISLLQLAFTHRSFLNENREYKEHNERLEFLGDAVLELVATSFLFNKYPQKDEGELTAVRAALVNTHSISSCARDLGMNDYLLLSKGESKDTGRARQYILANTFEAFVGALYLDHGYESARLFIEKNLFVFVEEIVNKKLWQDHKSKFQELAQERVHITPHYEHIKETGPDHNKVFTVNVVLDDVVVATGNGKSKQEAEQNAAHKALEIRGWE